MSMNEIDALIVSHLDDIEAAIKRINEGIHPSLGAAIDNTVRGWCRDHGWSEGGDFADEKGDGLWLAPSSWMSRDVDADPEGWRARFWIDAGEEITSGSWGWEVEYWISQLCGVGEGKVGLKWRHELTIKKTLWRRIASDFVERFRAIGFHYLDKEGSFLYPFQLKKETLSTAIMDDALEEALEPLKSALDSVLPAESEFHELLIAAEKELVD